MDPWLKGPANFHSWWHFPAVTRDLAQLPPLDYIYISHLHGDHFHVPTLEKLDRRPTVLIPRLYHNRMVRRLYELGFTRIQELPHAKEVDLTRATKVTLTQMGGASVLAVAASSASMLNANDALQGAHPDVKLPLLRTLAARYGFDIVFLAFGTAGPFPKCYQIEDMSPRAMDPWLKERSMLSNFVSGAKTIKAKTVVPFAGGFALLAEKLLWMNEAKTTPADALSLLREREPGIAGLEMNPGDIWDSREGVIHVHPPVNWGGGFK
jgi:UDP-MurNAc hydroxylase